jgi:hypothetical protein
MCAGSRFVFECDGCRRKVGYGEEEWRVGGQGKMCVEGDGSINIEGLWGVWARGGLRSRRVELLLVDIVYPWSWSS